MRALCLVLALGLAACDSMRPAAVRPQPQLPADAGVQDGGEAESDDDPDAGEPERLSAFDDWRNHHEGGAPCPPEMVYLQRGNYCIDRWEGSLVEITPDGVKPFPHNEQVGTRLVRAESKPGVPPQGYISGAQAQRGCEMAGKRLCTDWEWFHACAGPHTTIYPYGTVHRKGACKEERKLHPVVEFYGADAGKDIWDQEPMNNPGISAQPDTVALTGSLPLCVGPTGLYDMIGNVHEWGNDPMGTFHGGAYSTNNKAGCQYSTTVHGFRYHDYSTGFRCCAEPWEGGGS